MRTLGTAKDGSEIVARGVNEDNSGVAVMLPMGGYEVRCYMPIGVLYDEDTGEETMIYTLPYDTKAEAVEALKKFIGHYSGW